MRLALPEAAAGLGAERLQKKLDIAIAGAGPAGLAAALYLKRAGHRVTIFERFEKAAPLGSGLILQATGLTVLHDLRLFHAIVALGARIDRLYGTDAESGRAVLDVRYATRQGGRFGLAVHRAALFGVLHRAALREGIPIETGVELDAADGDGKVVLTATGGRRVGAFDLLVDASGSRSRLKRHARGTGEPRPLAYGALWASLDWREQGFDAHALLQRYARASVMIGVLPIGSAAPGGRNMAAFFWSLKPDTIETVRSAGLESWKERVVRLWPACEGLVAQIDGFDQLALARYGHHTLGPPVGRRLAIVGDAAHSTSPQLGQGANMALLDARALAHALDSRPDVDTALHAYVAARRRHVRVFQALSRMLTPFYQSDSLILPLLRDRLVPVMARVPPAPQLLAAMVAGTLVDPFTPVGLREAPWSALARETLSPGMRPSPAETS